MPDEPKDMNLPDLLDEYIPLSLRWSGGGNPLKAYNLTGDDYLRFFALREELDRRFGKRKVPHGV